MIVMFLQLAHTKLDVYKFSQELALGCYQITKKFPNEEKFALVQQIRRAAISVYLNIAEGCSRKSEAERKRFYEISRESLIEIDTAVGVAYKLGYVTLDELKPLSESIIKTFKILSGMIK
jgi:four helix bundle protein